MFANFAWENHLTLTLFVLICAVTRLLESLFPYLSARLVILCEGDTKNLILNMGANLSRVIMIVRFSKARSW